MSVAEATETETRARIEALAALAESGRSLTPPTPVGVALESVARAAAEATGAGLAIVRIAERDALVARAVSCDSDALPAELHGSRCDPSLLAVELTDVAALPSALAAAAARISATATLVLPLERDGSLVGSLELYRAGEPFNAWERLAARVAATQALVALTAIAGAGVALDQGGLVEVAGDALAAASDEERAAERILRLAARAAGAGAGWLWTLEDERLELAARFGTEHGGEARPERAHVIVDDHRAAVVDRDEFGSLVTLRLGAPPVGALQLRFAEGDEPSDEAVGRLASFAVRAAHALRASAHVHELGVELDRSRALIEVVGQAIAELSLAHTLETAVERVAELLGTGRVGVYLLDDEGSLSVAAAKGLRGSHERLAAGLLELALGPAGARRILAVPDVRAESRLPDAATLAAETDVGAALALPLAVAGEAIGLLVAYPRRGRVPTENETALFVALAGQLSVAVQNARLHERAKLLGADLEQSLAAERAAARRLGALYEISRSFAQSLSLEATLDAVAKTATESLDVDAAVIRMPNGRGTELETRALHVVDPRLAAVVGTILSRPQPLASAPLRRLLRNGEPLVLDAASATGYGGAYALLAPFLAKGSSAAVVPIATPAEVLGTLSIISFHSSRPVDEDTIAVALSIAGQAALAIDNARLYQQQKAFADAMQRSLLPRSAPQLPGLEVGDVYESAATVDVGGDVYDYLALPDGRLAVVLGDVMGHGVDATADMAMAKFVFRSLAREHPEPGDFLAAANAVVCGEIAHGKFITMVQLLADPTHGVLTCACAGHPAPRLVHPSGSVEALPARGLALGVDENQHYDAVEVAFREGAGVVAFTDGVIEARRRGELFGLERLDAVLAQRRHEPAAEIARAVLEACRAWSESDLADDCAVVVIKRTA